ncbi:MAG: right-handed parallel beta-helix repeat-containing protein [Planctomycetota bacterium]|nr:MAG: right-handed parallel beta-helix repeat-containing protein [Planctomycetota bacterium]
MMRWQKGFLSVLAGVLCFGSAALAGPQVLEVSPRYLEFTGNEGGANPAAQAVSIWNSGHGPMDWTVTPDCNWITVEPNTGSSSGEVDDANVIVDINELAEGTYNCQLTVTGSGAPNSPQVVDVNLVMDGPIRIELSPTQFEFTAYEGGANPDDQILSISNSGGGTLNWEITEGCGWLTAEPNSGSSTGEIDDVNLSVDITGLSSGIYDCNLTVVDPYAANSPQIVGVNLIVGDSDGQLHVPSEYGTIQTAIDMALIGDEVIIEPNTYTGAGNYNIDFGGKAITVRSTNPEDPCVVATTVIDCQNANGRRGFYFHSGESMDSIVSGLTIKRGKITSSSAAKGGGIYCSGSSPTIKNCIISNNHVYGSTGSVHGGHAYGGAIFCSTNSSPVIANCTINNNSAEGGNGRTGPTGNGGNGYGAGVYCDSNSNPIIKNCIVAGNTASGGDGGNSFFAAGNPYPAGDGGDGCGAGIYGSADSSATIINSSVVNNQALKGYMGDDTWGGGVDGISLGGGVYSNGTISNCILWGNTADSSPQIYGSAAVSYSDVGGGFGGIGNIDADPCFADAAGGDYHLRPSSPCVDAGDLNYAGEPNETDIDGEPRIINGRIDMGADEYNSEMPFLEVSPLDFAFSAEEGGPNPNDQILSISNSGGGTLNWEIMEVCGWLTVEPNSGSSTGEVDDVNLSVDITGLAGGTYNCQLTVSDTNASNSPQIVDVNLVLIGPLIEVSATKFEFSGVEGGANPNDQILSISNSGGGTLNWEAMEVCGWLTVVPDTGSSTGEIDDVNLSVDISGLGGGVYDCNLTISDANAANSPQIVGVTLHVWDADGQLHVPSEYGTIQAAIDMALTDDEVIVEPGTYTGTGNRDLDFGGKAITVRSTNPEDPCVVAATMIDCENVSGRRGFYFHSGEGPDSVISGLTIKRGKIVGNPGKGGGIYCTGSSPTMENCVITSNQARGSNGDPHGRDAYGGGIYCESASNPMIIECSISNNTAGGGGGDSLWCSPMSGCTGGLGSGGDGYGGGIYSSSGSNLTIVGCIIGDNSAWGGSGGVYYETGEPVQGADGGVARGGGIYCGSGVDIEGCAIVANTAKGGDGGPANMPGSRGVGLGGGIYGVVTISNSTVSGNQVLHGTGFAPNLSAHGGGIASLSGSSITNCLVVNNMVDLTGMVSPPGGTGITGGDEIVNCTIYNNWSGSGPDGSYAVYGAATTEIRNCIVWGNDGNDVGGTDLVTYTCTEGVISGAGNINSDPCFVTGPLGDYYLGQIAAGQGVDSPCVDAGSDTASNLGLEIYTTRTDEVGDAGVVDMGYHYSIPNPADIDEDGDVDFVDFDILASQWEDVPGTPSADVAPPGGDGMVDGVDLGFLVKYWLWEE